MALLRIVCREQAFVREARFIRTNNVKAQQPINFSYRSDRTTTWNHELSNIYIKTTVSKLHLDLMRTETLRVAIWKHCINFKAKVETIIRAFDH